MTTERKREQVWRLSQQYGRAVHRAERLRRLLVALAERPAPRDEKPPPSV